MKIVWWETCLVVFIPLLLLFLFSFYRLYLTPHLIPNCKFETIKPELQTGDLIFIRYRSKYGKLIRVVTGADWSHIAFVYRQGDKVFLVEVADYTSYDEPDVEDLHGLCIIPLKKWLQLNDARICGYRKYQQARPLNSDVQRLLQRNQDITLDMDLYNWSTTLFRSKNSRICKNNYFCSEFIASMLQELGMLSDDINPGYYSPARLATVDRYAKMKTFYLGK